MEAKSYHVLVYQTETGKEPFTEWRNTLDKSVQARIDVRIDRLAEGNFGSHRHLSNNLYEIKYHFGSGYRLYFGLEAEQIIILLTGGDKSVQQADIDKASEYWAHHNSKGKSYDII